MRITKAILATNELSHYRHYWPWVARAWRRLGIEPVVADLRTADIAPLDGNEGIVVSIPVSSQHLHTAHAAQCIRLLLGCLFPDDVCILSDIDMLPISVDYFVQGAHIAQEMDDRVVVFRPFQYIPEGNGNMNPDQIPICYVAARGTTWRELFPGVTSMADIIRQLEEWQKKDLNWCADQRFLHQHVAAFPLERVVLLKDAETGFVRIDRGDVPIMSKTHIDLSGYSDFHMPGFQPNRAYLLGLLNTLGISS